ncbi:MAG: 5-methyltetrahydropteroyltriglutamate--homocysteine S-methyltransferase [Candidatus Parcubacteria bacterium]|nr:5-methyltetrahydropteroyltriglutamate--homocysteine S-methyltransferase [Burkholderiales bacterium]
MKPPFRADQVGSLLRPKKLADARREFKQGRLDAENLKQVEDECIRQAVARQEAAGLQAVTDGEMRREYWHLDFTRQLDGVTLTAPTGMTFNAEDVPPMATITGKVGCSKPIFVEHFKFLQSVATATPKLTIPAPAALHFRGGRNAISREAYPDLKEFWADTANAYRKAIAQIAAAGCRYLQLDDVSFAYLCDPKVRENFRANGDDPATLHRDYADAISAALKDRPADMTVTMHTCRGNFRSAWFASGGYNDEILEAMFSTPVDGYFMEYDTERSGGFEPLRLLPKGRKVVLGLVTTKSGALESKEALKRKIGEAARHVPLESLCLSPQCGFASTHHGNALSEDEQWRKLERVVEVAREVWN